MDLYSNYGSGNYESLDDAEISIENMNKLRYDEIDDNISTAYFDITMC